MMHLARVGKRFGKLLRSAGWQILAVVSTVVLLGASTPVAALTPQERQHLINEDIEFIDDLCGGGVVASGDFTSPDSGTWTSGLQPPYILEQFAIELLKDIAAKRGVPTSSTVTQDHVIALVTFAYGEGGGITNDDFWNPFNTGINATDLLATDHATNGKQAFKSFDAGVEANARVMSGTEKSKFQTRLGNVLTNPNSTTANFFHTLTYFNETSGNLEWAEASLSDPAGYYNHYMDLARQVIGNWDKMASLVMRGSPSDPKNVTDPSKLVYHPGGTTPISTTSTSGQGCCDTGTNVGNVIFLDPGHIGSDKSHDVIDSTRLVDSDYANHPELEDVWDVSQTVKEKLTAAGYKVVMSKDNKEGTGGASKYITLRERAQKAIDNHAALAVSIHDDANRLFDTENNIVYAQAEGQYRQVPKDDKVSPGKKIPIFASTATINASKDAADKMVKMRTQAEGHNVRYTEDATNDIGTRLPSPGSIWLVQLFSTVPWIYNEAGGHSAGQSGLNAADKAKYADGIVKGVEAAVPLGTSNTTAATTSCNDASNPGEAGGIAATAKKLAWSQPGHGKYKSDATSLYQQIEPSKQGAGFTSDNSEDPAFSDCGVFVATVMHYSGADPNYPTRNTNEQIAYTEKHPEKYARVHSANGGDPGDNDPNLLPGDIFITTKGVGHTYIYTGKWGDGNRYNAASASWFHHVPQATNFDQDAGGQHFAVFRLIK